MCSLRKILSCTLWNLRLLSKNLRFYMGLVLGFLICFFLTEKTISLAHLFGTNIQVVEPFVWCFADSDSVLFASLALLLAVTDSATGCVSLLLGIPCRTEELGFGTSAYNNLCQLLLYGVSAGFDLLPHAGPCFVVQSVERYRHSYELCASAVRGSIDSGAPYHQTDDTLCLRRFDLSVDGAVHAAAFVPESRYVAAFWQAGV